MNLDRPGLETRVKEIVAEALDRDLSEVQLHSSLTEDLGAESIDFLDIVFRLESAFGIKIPEDDIWRGSIDVGNGRDPDQIQREVERLRARMPEFNWANLPDRLTRQDLPRLITVRTIIDYLVHRDLVLPELGEPDHR